MKRTYTWKNKATSTGGQHLDLYASGKKVKSFLLERYHGQRNYTIYDDSDAVWGHAPTLTAAKTHILNQRTTFGWQNNRP